MRGAHSGGTSSHSSGTFRQPFTSIDVKEFAHGAAGVNRSRMASRRVLGQGGLLAHRAWSTILDNSAQSVQAGVNGRLYANLGASATRYGTASGEVAGGWSIAKRWSSSAIAAETASAGRVAYEDFSLKRKFGYWTKVYKELSKFRLRCAPRCTTCRG
eukprot:1010328-Pyramimonas_sp.AAC.1